MENSKRTFDIKQKAMVNKLHNMQWLKHASHSSNPGKVKINYKHIEEHDRNNKLKAKDLLTKNIKALYSVEDSDKYYFIDTYKRDLSIDAMPENDEDVWDKNVNLSSPFPNSKKLINHRDKGKKDTIMIAKSIVTAKLDAQFYSDKMQNEQSNQKISRNNAKDITQDVCSNLSNLQVDQDTQELNLVKRFDGNNNYFKSTQSCMPKINDKNNKEPMLEQCRKGMERFDKSKADIDQKYIQVNNATDNGQTSSFKYSSNLFANKCIIETPVNAIHQHPINKLEYTQHMDDVKILSSNQTTWNNRSFNIVQKSATIVNSQPIQDTCFNTQKISMQARDGRKQMLPWEPNNSKFYNTFNVASYGNNVQTSNNSVVTSILEPTMNRNKENPNILYKYAPNTQQKLDATSLDFTRHSILLDQTSRCDPLVQDGFHADPNNTMRPTITMRINNSNSAFGPDDSNNPHIRNCPVHPIIYAPSPNVQMWNPHSQYPVLPVCNNSLYANYTHNVIPNTINQSNNYNSSMQLKYIPCMQTNNYIRSTRSDLSNCTVQARNVVDNVPVKSNQHCKKSPDNSRMIYNNPLHVTSLSRSGSQQDVNFRPTTDVNQCSNAYLWPIQKHTSQNTANYVQMSKYQKSQAIQALASDDNESKNIRPIISPKEFITINISVSKNKIN